MKLLVLCQGTSLDSMLARGAERATCYLIVDPTTLTVDICPFLQPRDHATLMAQAAAQGVTAVLCGNTEPVSRLELTPAIMMVTFGEAITAREAVRRWRSGEILTHPARTETAPLSAAIPSWVRRLHSSLRGQAGIRRGWTNRATPRGRHHIQQYAGRGH